MDGQLNVVNVDVLTDYDGRSKGCGYVMIVIIIILLLIPSIRIADIFVIYSRSIVEFETQEEARRAIAELQDTDELNVESSLFIVIFSFREK